MDVRLPRLGEGAESGTVVNILVSKGDLITKDQTILELENEKAVAPIPSPAAGKVKEIYVKEGDEITAGQVLVSLLEIGDVSNVEAGVEERGDGKPVEDVSAPEPSVHDRKDASGRKETVQAEAYRYESKIGVLPPASPSIRKLARYLGIDLTRVRGSERGGRITIGDVRTYIQHLQKVVFEQRTVQGKATLRSIDYSAWGPIKKKRLSSLRQIVAQRMVESWTTIPHITQFDEADITSLMKLKEKYRPSFEKKGARLTLTSFALKTVIVALKKYPIFNSSLDEAAGEIVYKGYFHLGVAVDTEAGLIVPVIRDVDKKGLLELSAELAELVERSKQRKLSLEDLQGGTFTLSNQGGIGGAHFTPIIYKPQVAVLGLGQGMAKPVAGKQKTEIRSMLPVSLSYDHRVIDGADAARFIREIVRALETFKEKDLKV